MTDSPDEKTFINPEIDRNTWGSGPWDGEPDKVVWTDERTGLPCLAVRNDVEGHWCGYAAVEPGHPLHGVNHGDIRLPVHEGVNFSKPCREGDYPDWAPVVCHVPDEGKPADVWWFGFDCGHAFDYQPNAHVAYGFPDDLMAGIRKHQVYCTLDYVKECLEGLCIVLSTCGGDPNVLAWVKREQGHE